MEYLDFASDFNFLHEEEVLVPDQATIPSKDNVASFILVADEAYSLGQGQGVVQQYATWAGGGEKLIGEVRDIYFVKHKCHINDDFVLEKHI